MKRVIKSVTENDVNYENIYSKDDLLTRDLVLKILDANRIDTTPHKYEVVFCQDRGRGYLWEDESLTATWPGDFLATWTVAHAYGINDNDPIDVIMETYETVEEFEDVVSEVKAMSGDDMLSYYGDADKDFVVSLTNLDTGEVLIDNRAQYDEIWEEEPETFVTW